MDEGKKQKILRKVAWLTKPRTSFESFEFAVGPVSAA